MNYWIIVNDHHEGPWSAVQLVESGLTPATLVWTEGMTDWTPASEVEELAALISARDAKMQQASGQPQTAACEVETQTVCEVVETDPEEPAAEPACHLTDEPWQPAEEPQPACEPQSAYQPQAAESAPAATIATETEPCPPAYIAWAIIATVLCCVPVGIPAIIFASMTKSAYYKGDLKKAKKYSELAQWFIIGAIVAGCVGWPFQLAFI